MWHVRDTEEVHTGFPSGDLRERDHFEDLGRWENNTKMTLHGGVWGRRAWTGLIWLRIGTGGGCL